MSKDKLGDRKLIENLLISLPAKKESYQDLFKLFNTENVLSIKTIFDGTAVAKNIIYSAPQALYSVFSSPFESVKNLTTMTGSALGHGIGLPLEMYNKGASVATIVNYIVENGLEGGNLFSQIAEKQENKTKITFLLQALIDEINQYDKDLESLKTINDEILRINKEMPDNSTEKEEALRDELIKKTAQSGALTKALSGYKDILNDFNDEKTLGALISRPSYEFKILHNKDEILNDRELGVYVNSSGRVYLKSKLGKKEQEINVDNAKSYGISQETFSAIQARNIKEFDQRQKAEFAKFVNEHDFPGVLKNSIQNLLAFTNSSPEEAPAKQIAMVNGFVELITQEHVKEQLIPRANQKLVDHIFALDSVSPAIKEYGQLVHDLANEERAEKFNNLFKTLINQDPELSNYVSSLMEFIVSPSFDEKKPDSPEYIQANKAFVQSNVDLVKAINSDVIISALPLIDDKLIENVFKLSKVEAALHGDEVKRKAKEYVENVQNKVKAASEKSNSFMGKIIEKFIKTKNPAITQIDETSIDDDLYKEFKTILTELEEKEKIVPKAEEVSLITIALVKSIRSMAKNKEVCEKLKAGFEQNQETMTKAIDKVIEHPAAGAALRGFWLNGKETAEFLPKVMNEKGLNAIADYVEKPSVFGLINIFYQTKTLGFAVSHYMQSLIKTPQAKEIEFQPEQLSEKLKEYNPKATKFADLVSESRNKINNVRS